MNIQKIKELLARSSLSEKEQSDFLMFLSILEDEKLAPVVQLFSEDAKWISVIYQNIKEKHRAFLTNDASLWKKIAEEEEGFVGN